MGVSRGFPWVSGGFRHRCKELGPNKVVRFTMLEDMSVGFPNATEYPYYNINTHKALAQWTRLHAEITLLEF